MIGISILVGHHTVTSIVNQLRSAGCVFAEDETQLLVSEAQSLEDLIKKVEMRVDGLPLEHVIGWAPFCGLQIEVERGVFVPRKRTEFLVRQAEELACSGDLVVDLCCGSGAIGAALAAAMGDIMLYGSDIDPIAIPCARKNVSKFGGHVFEGDLYEALPQWMRGRINILVANVPYVPTKAIELLPLEARLYEPNLALDGGVDGLNILRRVVKEAPDWLAPGGHLLIETSEMQASRTFEVFAQSGLATKVARDAERDATVVIGTNSGDSPPPL
ncbi:release factor glutamine methyltransferase [Bacillus sp. SLBN-46]|nr:release factor glutamine methyltransferase [Bacillus sp. SLBN-46]